MKSWQYHGEPASSSSNLSAFAPPFTVSPLTPNPTSNPYEPLLGLQSNSSQSSWLSSNPHVSASDWAPNLMGREFGPMNYPSEHEYPHQAAVPAVTEPFSYGQFPDVPRTNVDDVRPYYPQYLYSRVEPEEPSGFANQPGFDGLGDDRDHVIPRLETPAHAGKTWSESANSDHHELAKLKAGYCTKQGNATDYNSYINQGLGAQPSISLAFRAEASNNVNLLEMGKHDVPKCQEVLDAKSFLANNLESTSRFSSTTLNSRGTPVLPAVHSESPSLDLFSDLRKDQMKHITNIHKRATQGFSSTADVSLNWVDPFPAISTRPQASAPVLNVLSGNHGNGSISSIEQFSIGTPCSVKETRAAENAERSSLFDARLGQGRNDFCLGKLKNENMQSNEKFVSGDASVPLIRKTSGVEVSSMNAYGSNVSSFEALNHLNHAMDSSCWKGMPVAHFGSSFVPSSISPPKHLPEVKELDGLNPQSHGIFAQNADSSLKMSFERPNEAISYSEYQSLERTSMLHQEQPCVFNPAAREQSFEDAYLRQRNSCLNELTNDSSFEPLWTKRNNSKDELHPGKRNVSGDEDDIGKNVGDDSNNGLSDVSFQCVEHVLSSPPRIEPAERSGWYTEELNPKIDVSMVVQTMHNLSELLMFCSSNGACELKEEDYDFLKNATNNLIVFCLNNRHLANNINSKNPRIKFTPEEVFLGEFPGVPVTLVEVKRLGLNGQLKNDRGKPFFSPPFIGGPKMHDIVPNNPEKIVSGRADVVGDDKMTQSGVVEGPRVSGDSGKPDKLNYLEKQCSSPPDHPCENSSDHSSLSALPSNRDAKMAQAIKTILAENFHEEEEAEPDAQLFKNLWLEAEAALCSVNYRARYDRMKFEMEKSNMQNGKGPSEKKFAAKDLSNSGADTSAEEKSTGDPSKSHEFRGVSGQNLCPVNDVIARFNILKDRDSKLNMGNALDDKEKLGTKVSYDLNEADGTASEICETPASPVPVISQVKGSIHQTDNIEPSVLSRYSILKQREEGSSSVVNHLPDLSKDISGRSLVGQENSTEASVWGRLSILKQREDHPSASEMEAEEMPEALSLKSSVLSRLSTILKQREDNLSSMGWDCTQLDVVNLESVLKRDYFPPIAIGERTNPTENYNFIGYGVPESRRTGAGAENPTQPAPLCDFNTSSEWEHVLKEEV